jgi:hypothetical protein
MLIKNNWIVEAWIDQDVILIAALVDFGVIFVKGFSLFGVCLAFLRTELFEDFDQTGHKGDEADSSSDN